jgi:hypothetical protein
MGSASVNAKRRTLTYHSRYTVVTTRSIEPLLTRREGLPRLDTMTSFRYLPDFALLSRCATLAIVAQAGAEPLFAGVQAHALTLGI